MTDTYSYYGNSVEQLHIVSLLRVSIVVLLRLLDTLLYYCTTVKDKEHLRAQKFTIILFKNMTKSGTSGDGDRG